MSKVGHEPVPFPEKRKKKKSNLKSVKKLLKITHFGYDRLEFLPNSKLNNILVNKKEYKLKQTYDPMQFQFGAGILVCQI